MRVRQAIAIAAFAPIAVLHTASNAFFFFIPLPNLAKPGPLNSLIDALEKSDETKAVAYVSEDKTFGSKYWVWGHYAGHVPQAEADRQALQRCQTSLANAKAQAAGGKPLYDFGSKTCELYSFANKTVSPRAHEWQPPQTQPQAATPPVPQTAPSTQPAPAGTPPAASAPAPQGTDGTPSSAPQAQPSQQPASSPPPASQQSESTTAKKLRELEALRKEGLISEAEYQEKRKAIIANM